MPRHATTATVDIDRVLRDRIMASADRIIKMMPLAAKTAAISSVDVTALVLNIARGIPAVEADDPDEAEEITNAIAFKRRMIEQAGGVFDAEAVRKLLRHKTVQAVYKAARDRRLLMIEDNGAKLFPAFQFDGDTIRSAIPRLLAAVPGVSGWTLLQFLVSGDEGLGEERPIDLIKADEADVARVIRFAQTLND
ncbi:hypothetical protein PX699_16775 [Sphingobium sp. H39-3-25]|uniref:hypothetical protein n=1 Tax=Sphingomonadales TaxID=204457 RepID=UPI0008298CF8|nr:MULTISPECIES: hypothetical protein [Sphingomonadaceae]MDF0491458.1 hypothetical protein [Sphingomonas pollutisoli]MDF0544008.1 hypothetical protein [Sphingobium arseniciresistens]